MRRENWTRNSIVFLSYSFTTQTNELWILFLFMPIILFVQASHYLHLLLNIFIHAV